MYFPYLSTLKWIGGGRLNLKMSSYMYRDSHYKYERFYDQITFVTGIK